MERSSDLELLQQEINNMGGVASRIDMGITALHRARLEEEEAAKKFNAQSRNPDGSFALDGSAGNSGDYKSVSGIGEMLSVRMSDWDQEDGLNPLLHTLMNGLYDVNITNALTDIVDPLRDEMRELTHAQIRTIERNHKEDMMWQAMQLNALKGGANANSGSPFQRMYLLWNNFMRQPFWNSVNLGMRAIRTVMSPIVSSFNHVLFGDRTPKSDTDRIVTAIDKQTQLIRNGIIIDKMPYEDMHKYGLVGGSLKWLGEKALSGATFGKVSRKNAQRIEDDRARSNRGLSSFEDFLLNRVFTVNRRQTNLSDPNQKDPNESLIEEIKPIAGSLVAVDMNGVEAVNYLKEINATVEDIRMLMRPHPSTSGTPEQATTSQRSEEITEIINRVNRTASNDSVNVDEILSRRHREETSVVDLTAERRRREEEEYSRRNIAEVTRTQLVAGGDVVPVSIVGTGTAATPSMSDTTVVPMSQPERPKGGVNGAPNKPSGSLTPTTPLGMGRPAENKTQQRHETTRNAFARKHNIESLDSQINLQEAANDEQEVGNKLSRKILRVLEKLHGVAVFQSFIGFGRMVGSVIGGAFDKLSKVLTAIGGALGIKKLAGGLGKPSKNVGGKAAGKAASGAARGVMLGRMGAAIGRGAAMGGMGGVYGIAAGVITALASDIIIGLIPQSALDSANDKLSELSRNILDMSAKFKSWLGTLFTGTKGDRNGAQEMLYGLTEEGRREAAEKEARLTEQRQTQTQIRERLRIPEGKTINDNYVPLSTTSEEFIRRKEEYYRTRNELTSKGIKGQMDETGKWVPVKDSNGNPVRLDGTRPEMEAVNPPIENSAPKPVTDGRTALGGAVASTVETARKKGSQMVQGGRSMFDRLMEKMTIAESGGKQHNADGSVVKSQVGATGVLQIMPKTGPDAAKMAGLPWDKYRFEHDIDYNRALGIAYMQNLMKRYSGDAVLSTAAYNWGMGNVDNLIAKIGDPRTQMVSYGEWIRHLPSETYNYVKKTAIAANDEARAGIGNAKNYLASVGANVKNGMVGGYQTTVSGVKDIASGVKDYAMSAPQKARDGFRIVTSAVSNATTAGKQAMARPQYAGNYGVEESEGQAAAAAGAAAAMSNSQITVAQSKPSTPVVDTGPLNTSRNPAEISRAINKNSRISNAAKEQAVASVQSNTMGSVDTASMERPAEKPQPVVQPDNNSGTMVKILSSIDNKLGQIASNGNVSFDPNTVLSIFGR